jgi:hypothetical protein
MVPENLLKALNYLGKRRSFPPSAVWCFPICIIVQVPPDCEFHDLILVSHWVNKFFTIVSDRPDIAENDLVPTAMGPAGRSDRADGVAAGINLHPDPAGCLQAAKSRREYTGYIRNDRAYIIR